MSGVPLALSGTVSIALIVVLGIFVFPWLLTRRGGGLAVAGVTALLVGLFVSFQLGSGDGSGPVGTFVAALLGCAPAVVALIVRRLQGGAGADKSAS